MDTSITKDEIQRYDELCVLALNFARYGQSDRLKSMLESKLPVNLQDHKGNTLLMLAAYNGNLECVKLLISFGAIVDKKNDRGQTPLAGVCFKGYLEIVKLLVKAGANIYENNGLGTTPIMFASMFGNYDIVKYLNEQNSTFKSKMYLVFSKFIGKIKSLLM